MPGYAKKNYFSIKKNNMYKIKVGYIELFFNIKH